MIVTMILANENARDPEDYTIYKCEDIDTKAALKKLLLVNEFLIEKGFPVDEEDEEEYFTEDEYDRTSLWEIIDLINSNNGALDTIIYLADDTHTYIGNRIYWIS